MPRRFAPAVRPLEGRYAPSVTGLVSLDPAGVLRFTTDAGPTANAVTVSFAGGAYTVHDAAAPVAGDATLPAGWSAPDPNTVVVPGDGVLAVFVVSGDGDDAVTVESAAGAVNVDTGAGRNAVTLGGPAGTGGLTGPSVVVGSTGGTAALTLDDAADPDPRPVLIDGPTVAGLTAAAVSYTPGEVTDLTVRGGSGGNTITVTGTPADVSIRIVAGTGDDQLFVRATGGPLALDGDGGYDQITLGAAGPDAAGTTADLAGPIGVASAAGGYELTVDDSAGTADRSVTFSDGGVTGLTPGGVTISAATIVTLRTGGGADTFTPAGPVTTPTLLYAGPGDDRLILPDRASPNAVYDPGPGTDTIDCSAWTAGVTIDLTIGVANGVNIVGVMNAVGGAGNDTLIGDADGNVLAGGGGSDTYAGGDGDDTYVLTPTGGSSAAITDSAGTDTLTFARAAAGVTLDLDAVGRQQVTPGGDAVALSGRFEHLVGSPFDDVLTAGPLTVSRTVAGGGAATASPGDTVRLGSLGLPWTTTAGAFQVQGYAPLTVADAATVLTPPSAADDRYRGRSNRPLDVPAPGVLGNDGGPAAAARLVAGPRNGALALNPDGSFRYVPNPGFAGTDSFVYRAADAAGAGSPGVVTLTVESPLPGLYAVGAGAGGGVRVFNPDGTTNAALLAFPDAPGGVRVAVADFDGDGTPDVAAGTGPGTPARVRVVNGTDGSDLYAAGVFDGFAGGVFLAAGDLDGDGKAELVVTPDEGGGPRVQVFRGGDFAPAANFFGIADPAFRGGVRPAVGDLNGDGRADLVVAAGFGGGPRVALFDGATVGAGSPIRLAADFFLFEPALRNGAYVAVGDIDGDGMGDLVGGAGPGGGPRVLALSGRDLMAGRTTAVANFFAGNVENRGGVRVAVKNLDGDGRADLVVGDGAAAGSRVTTYAGKDFAGGGAAELTGFDAVPGFTGGVFVG